MQEAGWLPLLWLLLPVAAWSGWLAARRSQSSSHHGNTSRVPSEYFRGLNYLLNEQPDKAIEVFVRMAEVDGDTVETHLALGNLFRRRGEVDRAIRIHQNLMARTSLTREQRLLAMLELGMDYMRSGLLDRAEGLFRELVDTGSHVRQSLEYLLDIYQQEHEWQNAITTARRLQSSGAANLGPVLAHFHCELADESLRGGRVDEAPKWIQVALENDPKCVRATLIEAGMEENAGNPGRAIEVYRRIEQQDSDYLPEAIIPLQRCHSATNTDAAFDEYMTGVVQRHGGIKAQLMNADLVAARGGDEAAVSFLTKELSVRPSVPGINHLLELVMRRVGDPVRGNLAVIRDAAARMVKNRPIYRCTHCGFAARLLYWQCPGCKHWNTVKPVHGVELD